MDLYMTFVDLTKAFGTVNREGLWKIIGEIWLSDQAHSNDKFIGEAVTRWYACTARVQNNGASSDPFPVTNIVKQGCVLAQTLFSMMFSAMLTTAFQDGDNGIPIRYRF